MTDETPVIEAPVLNVYQRFLKAVAAVDRQVWQVKDGNSAYRSVPIDDMRMYVRKACIEARLVKQDFVDLEITRERIERTTRYYGSSKFVYINADDPSDRLEFWAAGEAMDNGDKGTGKLLSNILKNHYKGAFDIGEQGKDDIDSYRNEDIYVEAENIRERLGEGPRRDSPRDRQLAKITEWLNGTDRDSATARKVIAEWKEKHGGKSPSTWSNDDIQACQRACLAAIGASRHSDTPETADEPQGAQE